ncbi:hypothetical protein B0T22DRAFT_131089 [Podospora appendiculata]|uniref:Protein kinase domain-containing protein n=1 Tax=Podospora appendiculata TaxID=314037 RepID=A0AAE0X7J8_9PEZI|nr:hypothetical protein B0T22DRAFT_131089 [Podospora appendiculata]
MPTSTNIPHLTAACSIWTNLSLTLKSSVSHLLMAQAHGDPSARDTNAASPSDSSTQSQPSLWRRLIFGRDKDNGGSSPSDISSRAPGSEQQDDPKAGLIRRVSRKVVPGLPRAQTFKRQQSELRNNLEPVQPTPAERRTVSVDRRAHASNSASLSQSNPRTSAPDFSRHSFSATAASVSSLPTSPIEELMLDGTMKLNGTSELNGTTELNGTAELDGFEPEPEAVNDAPDAASNADAHSMTTSLYDNMIHDELERIWILNLSMHFRDKSKREKFFVTYRENNTLWRRVTISLDYRDAPDNSLELELAHTKFQRDKSAKIYEAIRESLADIQFYETVTNLKLQTTDGRLHVHVVEDVNEIINYPTVRMIQHMRCRRVKEREIEFDSHMSGFVYKVRVNNEVLIKKEIPGPDTVDEFLYEINALNRLRFANNVIQFYGVIVDDKEEHVKGLLISYAEQGALIDVIYDHDHSIPWPTREMWARQIVTGLSEIHEAGFVQGDFTLSNIVINDDNDAKIIDINRRGCPVGWEPPEATPLIESNQRISMYIGVKSDLYQLGMVLWALATQEDEPEQHGRPLRLAPEVKVPAWYRRIVEICLSEEPRLRVQALQLLSLFPDYEEDSQYGYHNAPSISVDDGYTKHEYVVDSFPGNGIPRIKTVQPPVDWAYVGWGNASHANAGISEDYYYPTRGRSPPSPLPSNDDGQFGPRIRSWSGNHHSALTAPSFSDVPVGELGRASEASSRTNEEYSAIATLETEHDEPTPIVKEVNGDTGLEEDSIAGLLAPSHKVIYPQEIQLGDDGLLVQEHEDPDSTLELDLEDIAEAQKDDLSMNGNIPISGVDGAGETEPGLPTNGNIEVAGELTKVLLQPEPADKAPLDSPEKEMLVRHSEEKDPHPPKVEAQGETAFDIAADPSTVDELAHSAVKGSVNPAALTEDMSASASGHFDDLKGIGSAYDLASEKRNDAITEDDFNVDIASSLAPAPAPARAEATEIAADIATSTDENKH